jgi:predicted permease
VPLPILAGLLYAQTGWTLPQALDKPLQVVGSALGPMALLLVGIALAHTRIGAHWRDAVRIAAVKNLALPVVLGLMAWALGLSGPAIAVMFTAAAMPVGANVLLFTQRYRVMQDEVSSSIAISAALALVTLPAALLLAQGFMR